MKNIAYLTLLLALSQAAIGIPCPTGDEILRQSSRTANTSSLNIREVQWVFYSPLQPATVQTITPINSQSRRLDRYEYEECFYKVKGKDGSVRDWGIHTK